MKNTAVVLTICLLSFLTLQAKSTAQLTVVEEHVFDFGAMATPWTMSVTVPYYDPANHHGAPLEEVMVILEGDAKTDVDVVAGDNPVLIIEGEVGAYLSANGFVSDLVIDVIPKGSFAPPVIEVPANSQIDLTDVTGTDMDTLVISGAENTASYQGTGGYDVDVDSIGTSVLSTAGGNMDATHRTQAQGRLTVQYKAIVVPEPASLVFLALGAVGLCILRQRMA